MTFRFAKLSTAYPVFERAFEFTVSSEPDPSYVCLHEQFIATRYGLSDFYSRRLEQRGHPSIEIFDVQPLQALWAREHGISTDRPGWRRDVLVAQLRDFEPNVVFLQDLYHFDGTFRDRIRQEVPSVRWLVGWRAAPTQDVAELVGLDLVLSSSRGLVDRFRQWGQRTALLRHAFAPELHEEVPGGLRDIGVSFVGGLSPTEQAHRRRAELVRSLLETTSLEVWSDLDGTIRPAWKRMALRVAFGIEKLLRDSGMPEQVRSRLPVLRRAVGWRKNPGRRTLLEEHPERIHPPVFGLDYYRLLGRSQITLNIHSSATGPYAANMRLFEATGMGTCLVTDATSDLAEIFESGTEVVTFERAAECRAHISALMNEPGLAARIADAGRSRTLRDHSYDQRVDELHAVLHGVVAA